MKTLTNLKKVRKFTVNIDEPINLKEHNFAMRLNDGTIVESIGNTYLNLVDENGEWVNDIEFESLHDDEVAELLFIIEGIEADDEKTMKRCKD